MGTQHTPGPWRFGKHSDDVVADVNAGHAQDQESLDFYGGHLVAESIASSNRALIAAAPELLDALQSLLREHDAVFAGREDGAQDSYYNAHPGRAIAYRKAREAVARATGGAA